MNARSTVDVRKVMTYSEVARALGVSRQLVWSWFREDRRIPAERVADVERVTGIPRHKLRPDLYDAPKARADA